MRIALFCRAATEAYRRAARRRLKAPRRRDLRPVPPKLLRGLHKRLDGLESGAVTAFRRLPDNEQRRVEHAAGADLAGAIEAYMALAPEHRSMAMRQAAGAPWLTLAMGLRAYREG